MSCSSDFRSNLHFPDFRSNRLPGRLPIRLLDHPPIRLSLIHI